MKKLTVLLLVVVLSLSMAACSTTTTPQKVTETTTTQQATQPGTAAEETTAAPAKTETFKIGDTVKSGDVYFTVNSVRENKGSEFIKPKEGSIYYLVDVTVENKSSESVTVSSILMFKLVDAEGYSHDITIGPETNGQLDGEVSAGRKLRGELAFEIPKDVKGLELEIDPSLVGTGKIIVKLDR